MADDAHAKTDQKLEEMEKRLSAIYSMAEHRPKSHTHVRRKVRRDHKGVYPCTSTQSKTTMNLQPSMSLHFWKPTQQSYRNV